MSHVRIVSQFLTPVTKLFGCVMNFGGTTNKKKKEKPRITGSMTGEGREEEMKYLLSTMGESDGYLY